MTDEPLQPIQPTQEELDVATQEADRIFSFESVSKGFSGAIANRFYIQLEPDGVSATLSIGATGVVAGGVLGVKPTIIPVATVHNVYRVERVFLTNLANFINTVLPPEPEQADGES